MLARAERVGLPLLRVAYLSIIYRSRQENCEIRALEPFLSFYWALLSLGSLRCLSFSLPFPPFVSFCFSHMLKFCATNEDNDEKEPPPPSPFIHSNALATLPSSDIVPSAEVFLLRLLTYLCSIRQWNDLPSTEFLAQVSTSFNSP